MIKIQFSNPKKAEAKYLKMVKPKVLFRLQMLKKTLDDIKGPATRIIGDEIDSYKVTTRELINLVADPEIPGELFNVGTYTQTVDNYVADPTNNLGNINLVGLTQLVGLFLDPKNKALDGLLTCPVNQLSTLNLSILNKYNLNTSIGKAAIKLVFNYKRYAEIAEEIKTLFREENIVLYCPYCNMLEADYNTDDTGEDSTIHYLDHFFDKATTPLLGYSMYNLVPCDGMCNGSTIKHTTQFSDEYHLSPYERGFDKHLMLFEGILGSVDQPLQAINVKVIPAHGTSEYRRLIGDGLVIDEGSKKGNINVFNIKSRYNRPHILKQNAPKMRKMTSHIANRDSLESFLKAMGYQQNLDNYKKWYYEEFQVEFDEKRFHENPFSKLIRDLHDSIVINSDSKNDDLKNFIQKS